MSEYVTRFRLSHIARFAPALPIVVVLAIYHKWFSPGFITYGDWLSLPLKRMLDYWPVPSLWNASRGLGGMDILSGPLYPELTIHGLLAILGVDDRWSERLIFAFPCLFVGCIGGYVFSYNLFRSRVAAIISSLFVVTNSYIVLIYGGGQLTVGVAYAFIPLILWSFRAAFRFGEIFRYVLTALFLALQATYDLRSTYITVWLMILYVPFLVAGRNRVLNVRTIMTRLVLQGMTCVVIILLVHAQWILPSLLIKSPALPSAYTAITAVFSTIRLESAIALLHPYWPFDDPSRAKPIDPLFFIIALLTFLPLLRGHLNSDVLYLYVVSILSIFFVKSNNPPAGQIYDWLFVHFPGFSLFRESSKFYQPLMVSSGILLGFAALNGARWLKHRAGYFLGAAWIAICAVAALYPASPVVSGDLAQSFVPRQIPWEYVQLNAMIDRQQDYFRTLWWPAYERFGTYSARHPAIEGSGNQYTAQVLQALSVKYVIVPYDPLHEIFNTGVGQGTQEAAVADAHRILHGFRAMTIGSLHVFVNPSFLPEVYVPTRVTVQPPHSAIFQLPPNLIRPRSTFSQPVATGATVQFSALNRVADNPRRFVYSAPKQVLPQIVVRRIDATQIDIDIHGAKQPFLALFLQNFDIHWQAYLFPHNTSPSWLTLRHAQPVPQRYHTMGDSYANAWWIDKTGSFTLILAYPPQNLVVIGLVISWLTILSSTLYIGFAYYNKKRKRATEPLVIDTTTNREGYHNAAVSL